MLFTDIHEVGTINFGSICSIKNKNKSAHIGHVLHSHHPPSSLFVDLQTRRAGRVLDGAMMASGKLAPEC